jgi:hypothetical protein
MHWLLSYRQIATAGESGLSELTIYITLTHRVLEWVIASLETA